MTMKHIQVYAETVNIVKDKNSVHVSMTGIDTKQVIAEFNAEDVLSCLEPSTIADYLESRKTEGDKYER
jgi:hypothetical protein